ncbi:MAG: MmcQ/YjbR family DNA-binding protein [Bacteroidetes bacterium]|nr:MmcQ/YjbR family DNA-binding protein [Bacteroidota bacterium]
MNIEALRDYCLSLPYVTEDIKWGADLCFSIGDKMFCVTSEHLPFKASLKVNDEEFEEFSQKPGIKPAAYLARYKWVLIQGDALSDKHWKHYIRQSYELVKAKLPKKILKDLI